MTVNASKVVKVLLSTYILLTFIINSALCKHSELIDELEGKELSLSERLAKQARLFSTDNLLTANLNGYYDTMVYYLSPEDLNVLPGFNTTKSTTVALLGHFALILSGVYFLSLLPTGALNGLIPSNPFKKRGRPYGRYRRRHRQRQPYYNDYNYDEYDEDYDYGYHQGPPRDHHRRLLRHGPPLFNRRMSEMNSIKDGENYRRNSFKNAGSEDSNDVSHDRKRVVKRQADADIPWWEALMNFAMGPFNRFQRSYSQIQDHYGSWWQTRLSADSPSNKKKSAVVHHIPPPPNLTTGLRSFGRTINGIVERLTNGVRTVAGVPNEAQRRSFNGQRRNLGGRPKRRNRHGKNRSRKRGFQSEEHYGPPPASPEEQVVLALHE